MSDRTRIPDWQEVHIRLEQARRSMESSGGRSSEEVARILRERAKALARPPEEAAPATEMIALLVFLLAGERFGLEMTHVQEVLPLRELIPVPCTPAFVCGVINYRGRILTVLDLRRLLNLPGTNATEHNRVILAAAGGMTFGIAAETIDGTLSVQTRKMAPPPEALTGLRLAITRGITEELITVLDLDTMARTPEILVNDEVG